MMKILKALRWVFLITVLAILLFSVLQAMMERRFYSVRSISSNATLKFNKMRVTDLDQAVDKRVNQAVRTASQDYIRLTDKKKHTDDVDIWHEHTSSVKEKSPHVLVTSSITATEDKIGQKGAIGTEFMSEDKKREIFEPVGESFKAALFNFSKFHAEDFHSEKPVIPHIIHQIFDTHKIPVMFKNWIKSIVRHHPDWEYWFWTVQDAECLIRKKYAQYLDIFKKYPHNIFRTDAFRYFVLYDYGGFYIDLDVEALKPLDFWTYYYPAVISWENYEHTYLSHKKREPNIMTTVLASKPKHPFFKMLQRELVRTASTKDVLQATGPFYLHRTYKKFMSSPESRYINSSIMTIHPKYWLPKHDTFVRTYSACNALYPSLTVHGKTMCNELQREHYPNSIKPESFLNHFWVHVNTWNAAKRQRIQSNVIHIKDIVPNVKLVSSFMKC